MACTFTAGHGATLRGGGGLSVVVVAAGWYVLLVSCAVPQVRARARQLHVLFATRLQYCMLLGLDTCVACYTATVSRAAESRCSVLRITAG